MRRSALARSASLVIAGAAIVGLTACAGPAGSEFAPSPSSTRAPSAKPSPSTSPSASPSPSPSAAASPPASAEGTGEPVGLGCLDLVSLDTMYEFDPNFGLLGDYSPPAGGGGSTAVANAGIACGWVQQTSGETIEIAVAHPSKSALAALKAAAGGGDSFSSAGGVGTVQAFDGPYWISATSTYFFEAGDARPLIDSAKAALG